jgi:hypothetical protein
MLLVCIKIDVPSIVQNCSNLLICIEEIVDIRIEDAIIYGANSGTY